MEFLRPTTWAEALAAKADRQDAKPIMGGTDVMVEMNFDKERPAALLDLTAIPELTGWAWVNGTSDLRIGSGMPYTRIIDELGTHLPGLAMASRTVGSPQIRNRGTVGGNLGSASPAGDAHPPLLAAEAVVEVESVRGARSIPAAEFFVRPKVSALEPDELIRSVRVTVTDGPQQFAKIGTRNAMVIAVCSFAVHIDLQRSRVLTGIGSAGPTPLRAHEAEEYLSGELDVGAPAALDPRVLARFGELVAAAASPIDDVRGTASYRRHALSVMAGRTVTWAWNDYLRSAA